MKYKRHTFYGTNPNKKTIYVPNSWGEREFKFVSDLFKKTNWETLQKLADKRILSYVLIRVVREFVYKNPTIDDYISFINEVGLLEGTTTNENA